MDYSYFKDTRGDWWWRLIDVDGSIAMESPSGYGSENECLEAIKRIKGTGDGSVLHRAADAPTVGVKTKKLHTTGNGSISQQAVNPKMTNETATQEETQKTRATTPNDSNNAIPDVILGESPVAVVFTTKGKQLRWRYKLNGGVVPYRLLSAVSEFDSIMPSIAVSVPKAYRKETYSHLGKALFAAFHTPEGTKPGGEFRKVRLFVRKKANERVRFAYLLASIGSAMVLALIVVAIYLLLPSPSIALVAFGGSFGTVGAIISVLQRSPSLELDPWMSTRYHALQGIARIVLGFIFGSIFVLASKANFVLGAIREDPSALLIMCIVAGLSERFIPELLSKFESSQSTPAAAKNSNSAEQ
jgi:uncharacterized protein YegP (UPF0339 family)